MKNFPIKNALIVIGKICFVLFAFYWVFKRIDVAGFLAVIQSIKIFPALLSLLALHISLYFSAMRSRYYFATFGLNLRRSFAIALYYVGSMFNIILPGGIGGDAYKIYYTHKVAKFSKLTALRIMFYERANGFYILVFFGLLLLPFTEFWKLVPFGFGISILLLVMVTPCYFFGVHYIIKDNVITALNASVYSLGVQAFQVISAALLIYAIYPGASHSVYVDYIFLFIVGSILAIIPVSIGGAGLRELSMMYGLQMIHSGTTIEQGIAFATLSFVLYVLTALTGLPLLYKLKHIKHAKRK